MAQYSVTHTCGHIANHSLLGKHTERDRKLAWLETQDCPACVKAAFNEAQEDSAAALREAPETASLPDLVGSEKQVNWATTIRAEKLAEADEFAIRIRVGCETAADREKAASTIHYLDLAKEALRGQSEARYWIDHRTNSGSYLVQECYREIKAGRQDTHAD